MWGSRRLVTPHQLGLAKFVEAVARNAQKCEICGGLFDIRDLGAVLDHEEPLAHPRATSRNRTARSARANVARAADIRWLG
jgi:hypothetical protein